MNYEDIAKELKDKNIRFWAQDNVSDYIGNIDDRINETEQAFEVVLKSLLIDTETDPNSKGTARRLAKMYWNEIFEGRYSQEPAVTAFPNEGEDAYTGMLCVRADIKSVCSHHHKDVHGVCYIGIVPNGKVIGLSKYIRIARWHARRGTLQEELTQRIAKAISEKTGSPHVGVFIKATHGCVSCRGVEQDNSNTQTCVLLGDFNRPDLKLEFFDNIKLQEKGQ